jgi:hypothetical protein
MRSARGLALCGAVLLAAIVSIGCHGSRLFTRNPFAKVPAATDRNPIVEVICLWEAAEGVDLDGLPCRGFAGKILFFTNGHKEPVKVNGDIRIYVFDDQGTPDEQTRPIHQFDFPEPVFQQYMTESGLGAAYQLFIPYTRKGSHRATCALRVRVTPPSGRPVFSKMASIILPGKAAQKPQAQKPPLSNMPVRSIHGQEIQQMSHEVPAPQTGQPSRTDSTSIETPASRFQGQEGIPVDSLRRRPQVQRTTPDDRQRLREKLSRIVEQSETGTGGGQAERGAGER